MKTKRHEVPPLPPVSRRRAFLAQSGALILAGCGGSGGGGSGGGSGPVDLKINSVSNAAPTALTPVSLATSGLDITRPFTVTLSLGSAPGISLTPMRTAPGGTVVIAVPPFFSKTSGLTSSANVTVQIAQGPLTSNAVALSVQDMPSVASYGAFPGQISRGFFNFLTLSLARSLNNLQAIQAIPSNRTDTSLVRASLLRQITDTIEMRSNVDLIVTGSQLSLSVGATSNGMPIQFDYTSVDMLDRMIAMHLQAVGYFPNTSFPATKDVVFKSARVKRAFDRAKAGNYAGLIAALSASGGLAGELSGIVNSLQPIKGDNTLGDNVVSGLSGLASLAGLIGLVAEAPVVITGAAVVGCVCGAYAVARDIYNIYESPEGITWNNGAKLTFDAAATVAGLFGASAVGTGLVRNVTSALENVGANGVSGLVMQGGGFVANTGSLVQGLITVADAAGAESAGAAPPQHFGLVDGNSSVSNSQGPVLSSLAGVSLTDPNTGTQFYRVAGSSGSYEFVVPIGVPGFNYAGMQLQTFDPVTGSATGSSAVVDLRGISPTATVQVPGTITGQCIDDDASAPDADDPDCD